MRDGWIDLPEEQVYSLFMLMKEKGELNKIQLNGQSMEPTIQKGAILELYVQFSKINIGDIITFINRNHLTTHRVIDVKEENSKKYYITKGDGVELITETVPEENVIGVVTNYHNLINKKARGTS